MRDVNFIEALAWPIIYSFTIQLLSETKAVQYGSDLDHRRAIRPSHLCSHLVVRPPDLAVALSLVAFSDLEIRCSVIDACHLEYRPCSQLSDGAHMKSDKTESQEIIAVVRCHSSPRGCLEFTKVAAPEIEGQGPIKELVRLPQQGSGELSGISVLYFPGSRCPDGDQPVPDISVLPGGLGHGYF